MTESLVQQIVAEVMRQQGEKLSSTKVPTDKPLEKSTKVDSASPRAELTNRLLADILVSPKESKKSASQAKILHREIKVGKAREELVGFAPGGTVGLVIPNLDRKIKELMKITDEPGAIGIISSRVGSASQLFAVDDGIKKTNSKVVSIQFARDGQGGPGHGIYIVLASKDVADVQRAVEISLGYINDNFSQIEQAEVGKVETHYTARAADALAHAFGAHPNRAFGLLSGAPAGIGLIMSDVAVKTAGVEPTYYTGPASESAFTNEVWLGFAGDSAAVKNALEAAKAVGLSLIKDYSSLLGR